MAAKIYEKNLCKFHMPFIPWSKYFIVHAGELNIWSDIAFVLKKQSVISPTHVKKLNQNASTY